MSKCLIYFRDQRTSIQAFSFGATSTVMIVAEIMANLLAFVALLEFANRTFEWFGVRAGVEITLEVSTLQMYITSLYLY